MWAVGPRLGGRFPAEGIAVELDGGPSCDIPGFTDVGHVDRGWNQSTSGNLRSTSPAEHGHEIAMPFLDKDGIQGGEPAPGLSAPGPGYPPGGGQEQKIEERQNE